MLWHIEHLLIVLVLSLVVTFVEIFFEYPNRYLIAYKSSHFYFLLLFNSVIGVALFIINAAEEYRFLNISDPWKLAFISGVSGFLFFNSKMDIKKNLTINNVTGLKSIVSGMKSSLYNGINEYVEEDYPNELRTYILKNFSYKKLDEYSKFVKDSVDFFTKKDIKKDNKEVVDMIERVSEIENISKDRKVYYFTRALIELKGPYWVKKHVVEKFCKIEHKR